MTVRLVHGQCTNCGMLGPEAGGVSEARAKAAENGWLIFTRRTDRRDYCPACRPAFEPKMCAVPHVDNTTGMALYQLAGDGRTVYACGMHSQKLQRELFASGIAQVTITLVAALGYEHASYQSKKAVR